jgi:hypothetical protein
MKPCSLAFELAPGGGDDLAPRWHQRRVPVWKSGGIVTAMIPDLRKVLFLACIVISSALQ